MKSFVTSLVSAVLVLGASSIAQAQVPTFNATAHRCEGVFETLNMITRMLLHKYIEQRVPQYA